jgi:hypothetical protein
MEVIMIDSSNVFRSNSDKNQDLVQVLAERCLLRIALLRNGYEPIPIVGKETWITGWTTGEITEERIIAETCRNRRYANTGLRSGRLVGIDIDLVDREQVSILLEIADALLGHTPLRRFGSKGQMLLYRLVDEPIGKMVIRRAKTETENARPLVEIFGQGGQFVAYGTHPDTKRPYRWLEKGKEPLTVPFPDLPPVTGKDLRELRQAFVEVLTAYGYEIESSERRTSTSPQPVTAKIEDARDITQLFLDLIGGLRTNQKPSGWINFACPSCRHDDDRSGFRVLSDGGFEFHCFHGGCEYNKTTGWRPPSYPGRRVRELYKLLGGDEAELTLAKRNDKMMERYRQDYLETLQMIRDIREHKISW